MKRYGLIGYPLTHSFSAEYFTLKFSREGIAATYENFPLPAIGQLPSLIEEKGPLDGFNVTIPYKEEVISYLDEIDLLASEVGAVNLVKITGSGDNRRLKGFNTDVPGFLGALGSEGAGSPHNSLVLGTGGASKAVIYALKSIGSDITTVSRSEGRGDMVYSQLSKDSISKYDLIVNTTPLGMMPDSNQAPGIPYEGLGKGITLFDLIYNPLETIFLKRGRERGCKTINGLKMLHLQAEEGWLIWNSGDRK